MSNDGPPQHGPGGQKKPMWPGFLLGLLVIAPALVFLSVAGAGMMPAVLLTVVVGSFALLFARDPMLKGIGAGVLTALAAGALVLFIACYQYLQDQS